MRRQLRRHLALLALLAGGLLGPRPLQAQQSIPDLIAERAQAHGAPVALMQCVAWHESSYNPGAVGAAHERGLFQLLPTGTLPMFYAAGYSDAYNAWENADFAATLFAQGAVVYNQHWRATVRLC